MARLVAACAFLGLLSGVVQAAQISGEYLEARSCDVYTGPCFANAEMDLAGKEALMAWRVEQGSWKGVYGTDSALIVGVNTAAPSYATITPQPGYQAWTWNGITNDIQALQKPCRVRNATISPMVVAAAQSIEVTVNPMVATMSMRLRP